MPQCSPKGPFPLVDDPATTFDETMCLEGNHGKTVSAVARGELVIAGIDVVDAAHSNCGKDAAVEEAEEVRRGRIGRDRDDRSKLRPRRRRTATQSGNGQGNGRGRGKPHDD